MKPRANRAVPLGVVLGVAVVGLLALPLALSARAADPASSDKGFVLLSMEQASLYRGTQKPGFCRGTGIRTECSGASALCPHYSGENCPAFARTYGATPIRYCAYWTPGAPGGCDFQSVKRCYTDSQCAIHPIKRECGTVSLIDPQERNDDVCTSPTPAPTPTPQPTPPSPQPG